MVSSQQIYDWLEDVKDPEIPVLSLVDLGVIKSVDLFDARIIVTIVPTFVGCPAIDQMREDIMTLLENKGFDNVEVKVDMETPWHTYNISKKGREALKKWGIAPPTQDRIDDINIIEHASCPRCHNTDTSLRNIFGTTLCRSIYYCHSCQESFEQFKSV